MARNWQIALVDMDKVSTRFVASEDEAAKHGRTLGIYGKDAIPWLKSLGYNGGDADRIAAADAPAKE